MPKITIAAINGACEGAGLAWACDRYKIGRQNGAPMLAVQLP